MEIEGPNGKDINIPTEEERTKILSDFRNDLKGIFVSKENVFKLSKKCCEIYYSYKDYIFPDLLQEILSQATKVKQLEYLYLIIEIIKDFNSNKSIQTENNFLFKIFPFVKEISRCFSDSFNDEFIKSLKIALNELKRCNIYPENYIDELIMEIRMCNEPNITDNINDRQCLSQLLLNNKLKIDNDKINLYKDIENLERTNNNDLRLKLINNENSMIEKQIKIYNENLKQIKCLNELIKICDVFSNQNCLLSK